MTADLILAIDQGTTSTRAIVFDRQGEVKALAQIELPQIYPQPGWVEHDPEQIWRATLDVCRQVIAKVRPERLAGIGITNQRETSILWDRRSGKPIYNAIVWQDRRTESVCKKLVAAGREPLVQEKTGLLLDPYFSATKIAWILDHVPGARAAANAGELAFGTIDSFLLWRLTGGRSHVTDVTNAARTLLFDIDRLAWDEELLDIFAIPRGILPSVVENAGDFGRTDSSLLGVSLQIAGMAGDQQAALIGQACFTPGTMKSTYGTGCFALLNTGEIAPRSNNRLLTTIGYKIQGKRAFALEGSIFAAGSTVQWLRDGLKIIAKADETEALARSIAGTGGVYLVPAFTGLGAPYWDPLARGALLGLTRNTGIAEIARAALEAVCYQTRDLLKAMVDDGAVLPKTLRVDGGMARNNWLMQFLAEILGIEVERPFITETTAAGAAAAAGIGLGLYRSPEDFAQQWQLDRRFSPMLDPQSRDVLYDGWRHAVARVLSDARPIL